MDIQSIRKIFFPVISKAINEMEEKELNCNITLLKRIVNEAIDGALNRNHSCSSSIIALFSGRGRAWAYTKTQDDNPVWEIIKQTLQNELNTANKDSKIFESLTNMIDIFEDKGIAWFRFGGMSNKSSYMKFHIRFNGSKLEDHIKVYIDSKFLSHLENLEGVPHKLGLEPGVFENKSKIRKEIINIEVSNEELNSLGIQTLDSLLEDL